MRSQTFYSEGREGWGREGAGGQGRGGIRKKLPGAELPFPLQLGWLEAGHAAKGKPPNSRCEAHECPPPPPPRPPFSTWMAPRHVGRHTTRPSPAPRILSGKAQALAEPLPAACLPPSVSVLFNNFRIKSHFSAESGGWRGVTVRPPGLGMATESSWASSGMLACHRTDIVAGPQLEGCASSSCQRVSGAELGQPIRSWPSTGSGLSCICGDRTGCGLWIWSGAPPGPPGKEAP